MGAYQKESKPVKPAVQLIDQEAVIGKASQGFLALSLEIGLDVIVQLMEKEVEELAGEKGNHVKERIACRHGKEQTKVVMGGKKAAVGKPRVRAKGGSGEIALDTLSPFQKEDPLDDAAPSRLLAGASSLKCAHRTASWASQRVKHGQERGVPQVQGRHGNSDWGILRPKDIWRISSACA